MAFKTSQNGGKRAKITYKQKLDKSDLSRIVRAIAIPMLILSLALITIEMLDGFGSILVAPATASMATIGLIISLWLPSLRSSILKETYITIGAYLVSLLAFRQIISWMSGVSSEMMMSTFNQAIPITSGNSVSGFMQNMMWITAALTPFGYLGMQAKRIFTFKRKNNKESFARQQRGVHRDDNHWS